MLYYDTYINKSPTFAIKQSSFYKDVHVKKIFKFCQAILFSSCFSENLASFFQ
ncbi:hypothetical protein FRX31_012804, partial [Thalictrum thalictroides]